MLTDAAAANTRCFTCIVAPSRYFTAIVVVVVVPVTVLNILECADVDGCRCRQHPLLYVYRSLGTTAR
jgi:hypothetical protein